MTIRVSVTARHTLHFDRAGRLQDVSERRTMRSKEVKEDGLAQPASSAAFCLRGVGRARFFFRL
jgi:hypothetical protein